MELSAPTKRFIEDNIACIEQDNLPLFFYNAMFALSSDASAELVANVIIDVLNIDPKDAINHALVLWCKDNIGLRFSRKVRVQQLVDALPKFGYNSLTFRRMLVDAVKTAYPNKTLQPDSYGIEYIVEKS